MASVVTTDDRKAEIRQILDDAGLTWFRCVPGFTFFDGDGAECIVIGWGGFRSPEPLGTLQIYPNEDVGVTTRLGAAIFSLKMHPATLVGAYLYKGEHHLISIPDMERLDECSPLEVDAEPKQQWHCSRCELDLPHEITARDDSVMGDGGIRTKCCRCGRETWR